MWLKGRVKHFFWTFSVPSTRLDNTLALSPFAYQVLMGRFGLKDTHKHTSKFQTKTIFSNSNSKGVWILERL